MKRILMRIKQMKLCLILTLNMLSLKDFGVVTFGKTQKEADVINDVVEHTMMAVLRADKVRGLSEYLYSR